MVPHTCWIGQCRKDRTEQVPTGCGLAGRRVRTDVWETCRCLRKPSFTAQWGTGGFTAQWSTGGLWESHCPSVSMVDTSGRPRAGPDLRQRRHGACGQPSITQVPQTPSESRRTRTDIRHGDPQMSQCSAAQGGACCQALRVRSQRRVPGLTARGGPTRCRYCAFCVKSLEIAF